MITDTVSYKRRDSLAHNLCYESKVRPECCGECINAFATGNDYCIEQKHGELMRTANNSIKELMKFLETSQK